MQNCTCLERPVFAKLHTCQAQGAGAFGLFRRGGRPRAQACKAARASKGSATARVRPTRRRASKTHPTLKCRCGHITSDKPGGRQSGASHSWAARYWREERIDQTVGTARRQLPRQVRSSSSCGVCIGWACAWQAAHEQYSMVRWPASRDEKEASPMPQGHRTILKLNIGVCRAPIRRIQIGSSISVPRAVVMSPTSKMSRQPKLLSSSAACAFAPALLPLMKTV